MKKYLLFAMYVFPGYFYIFFYNHRPISERRKLLQSNIKEIKNHVMLSEMKFVNVG